jgi:hypothetical protein
LREDIKDNVLCFSGRAVEEEDYYENHFEYEMYWYPELNSIIFFYNNKFTNCIFDREGDYNYKSSESLIQYLFNPDHLPVYDNLMCL